MTWAPLAHASDERVFGGKAARLAAASRAGLPVPEAIALSVSLTEAVAARDVSALAEIDVIRRRVGFPVAVRSSIVGEDGPIASFAGQHVTHLNVCSASELDAAIAAIWRSAHAPAALSYRDRLGIGGPPQTGALVQALVEADIAGVMFTQAPTGNAQGRLIEATWGLGGLVAAGQVVPDRYCLSATGAITERTPGIKRVALRPRPGGGTAEEDVAPDLIGRLCLDDDQLRALGELASRSEALFGAPQDVEWAFAKGELRLLQVRPITT